MDEVAVMELALRVFSAITERKSPAADDVAELRKLVPGHSANAPIDRIAREMIRSITAVRLQVRNETSRRSCCPLPQNAGYPYRRWRPQTAQISILGGKEWENGKTCERCGT
jgi:hypothetical protein